MKIRKFESIAELESEIKNLEVGEVYPFQEAWYFEIFCKNFCVKENTLILGFYEEEKIYGYGSFEKIGEKVVFLGMKPVLGKEEVTDFGEIIIESGIMNYESRIKDIWNNLLSYLRNEEIRVLQLDYVREGSDSYRYFLENNIGQIDSPHFVKTSRDKQETSPFIDLGSIESWESYLESLERVRRKELKRKIKRLEEINFKYEIILKIEIKDFEDFVRLHKLSDNNKDKFMSSEMKSFFNDIIWGNKGNWGIKMAFLEIDNLRVASLLYFENKEKVLMYNSGYDPSYAYYSAGVLLAAYVIKKGIEDKKKIVDFLRGNERYKYDLGAKDYWLYKIIVNL